MTGCASPWLACLAAFSVLVGGVMAESLDKDLIGVIAAGVCLAVFIIVIIAIVAFCCYRRIEKDRNASLGRKNSVGTASTNGMMITPRWPMANGMPVYHVPAPEPVMYAMPAHTSPYYMGHYAPKVVDAEYMRDPYGDHRHKSHYDDEEEHHVNRYRKRTSREKQEVTTQEQPETSLQPNGHVMNEFASSSENYRVIRKQHKHEKMPEWLRRSYGENERTMDLGDEVSRASLDYPPQELPPGIPEESARVLVLPQNGVVVDPGEVLTVPVGFTIVDYVDPEGRQPGTSSHAPNDDDGTEDHPHHHHHRHHHHRHHSHHQAETTSDVTPTIDVITTSDVLGAETITTKTVKTTTTYYTSEGEVAAELVHVSGGETSGSSTYMLSEPAVPRIRVEEAGEEEEGDDTLTELERAQLYHERMRNPGFGSVPFLPAGQGAQLADSDDEE